MTSVTNEYRVKYNLNTASKKSEADGDSYRIEGQPNMWVKVLKDNSKNKELEIRQQIGFGGYGAPMEVVYSSRGKFAGYTYEMEEAEPIPEWNNEADFTAAPPKSKSKLTQKGWFKIAASVVLTMLLALLNLKVFYPAYLRVLLRNFSEQTVSGCRVLSFSGMTGVIGGVVLMFVFGHRLIERIDGILYVIFEGLAFLAGVLLVDLVITVLVLAVIGAVSLILAVLPVIFGIGLVALLIRGFWKRK
jgi:hypothetical protein